MARYNSPVASRRRRGELFLVGIGIGSYVFRRTHGADLRRYVLWLLAILASATLLRAVFGA